jgi:uncharacterized membrane protein
MKDYEKQTKLAQIDEEYEDELSSYKSNCVKAIYNAVMFLVCLGVTVACVILANDLSGTLDYHSSNKPAIAQLFLSNPLIPFLLVVFVNLFFVHLILLIVHSSMAGHQGECCNKLKAERSELESVQTEVYVLEASAEPLFTPGEALVLLKAYKEQHAQGHLTDEQYQAKLRELDRKTKSRS